MSYFEFLDEASGDKLLVNCRVDYPIWKLSVSSFTITGFWIIGIGGVLLRYQYGATASTRSATD